MISLLIPTRGRSANIRRLAASVAATTHNLVQVVWLTDHDDFASWAAVTELVNWHAPLPNITHVGMSGEREIPCKRWNQGWQAAAGDIFGLLGDDVVMRTPGWDVMVEEAFAAIPGRIALVYGRDGFRDEVHASHPFLSQEWADALGRVTPEHFSQDMNDVWLNEIAEAVGRRIFLPDMLTQHLHPDDPSLGVKVDQTYLENRERRDRDRTHERYADLVSERAADIQKLLAVMT